MRGGCISIIGGWQRTTWLRWRAGGRGDECHVPLTTNGLKWIQLVQCLCARNSCLCQYSCGVSFNLITLSNPITHPGSFIQLLSHSPIDFPHSHTHSHYYMFHTQTTCIHPFTLSLVYSVIHKHFWHKLDNQTSKLVIVLVLTLLSNQRLCCCCFVRGLDSYLSATIDVRHSYGQLHCSFLDHVLSVK